MGSHVHQGYVFPGLSETCSNQTADGASSRSPSQMEVGSADLPTKNNPEF